MKKIQGIIFDVDGTLVDSNHQHTQAWLEALAEQGQTPAYSEVREKIGMGGDKLLPELIPGWSDSEGPGKKASQRRGEIFSERFLPEIKAFPDTQKLLFALKAAGLKLSVASSAKKDELDSLLRICGGSDVLEHQTCSEDASGSKPDPDIVEVALQRMGLEPDQVWMIGDTPYDVEAARKLGVECIAFRCGGWSDDGLREARQVLDGPAELLRRLPELGLV